MAIDETNYTMTTPNMNIHLWRYMDIPSFVYMIINNALVFVRADLFGDKYEGKLPDKTANSIDEQARRMSEHGYIKREFVNFSDILNNHNNEVFVNCWCNEKHEMVHMWKIYSKEYGVAIETDYETLKESIKTNEIIYPTLIKYIDFKKDLIHWKYNALTVYTLKRKEYKSENEFRLILPYPKSIENILSKNGTNEFDFDIRKELYAKTQVIECEVDINKLIKKIHISPYAPNWYTDMIIGLCNKVNLNVESITKSDL